MSDITNQDKMKRYMNAVEQVMKLDVKDLTVGELLHITDLGIGMMLRKPVRSLCEKTNELENIIKKHKKDVRVSDVPCG